jgi:GcrA cell cycle regulator
MYAQNWSFAKIAERLIGRSRNSVISRADRIGLPKRGKQGSSGHRRKRVMDGAPTQKIRRKSPFHFVPAVEPKADLAFTPRAAKVEPLMVLFDDLGTDQCRFAYGEEAPYLFCGHPQQPDSSYCPAHHRLCRLPAPQPTPRAERRAA